MFLSWRIVGDMRIFLYLVSVVSANIVTARFAPMSFAGFIVPMGTLFIGVSFILRDLTQMKYGRRMAYITIFLALILSALLSAAMGDTLLVVLASAVSFAISETLDTEVFTRLKRSYRSKVLFSGVVGGILDSSVFVLIGLSPLFGANIVPWPAVASAILGQVIVKTLLQLLGVGVLIGVKEKLKIVDI